MDNSHDPLKLAFIEAAAAGDLDGVKQALESGVDVNSYQPYKLGGRSLTHMTALRASAYFGHFEVVQHLVQAEANPYLPYNGRDSSRKLALEAKQQNIAKYLEAVMKLPKWVNKIDEHTDGYTPLTCVISYNYQPEIQDTINLGADVCRIDRNRKTPLIYAVERNSMEIVKLLIEKGAMASGLSAIKRAIELQRNDILKFLITIKEPTIIDACFDDGYTLLTKSIAFYHVELTKCLIENGADPTKVDLNHNIPLEKALEVKWIEVAELMISKGVKLSKSISEDLFHKLCETGNVEVFTFLVRNGWDINQVDGNGKSALCFSAQNEYLRLSRFLIENGASVQIAKDEVAEFRGKNMDFDWFVKNYDPEKTETGQTGQE